VGSDVEFAVRPLAAIRSPAACGWIVTNPPYGVRVGERKEKTELADDLGRLARTALANWTITALASDTAIGHALGPGTIEVLRTRNGGIPVRLLRRSPLATADARPAS
jgi:putative N6-adenine-specific DNA methylase